MSTTIFRAIAGLGGLVLAGYIIWATKADFWAAVDLITSNPWGQVTLVDLYLGFVLCALVIFVFEQDRRVAACWIVPIFFLGNVWTAIWFVVRAPNILRRLTASKTG